MALLNPNIQVLDAILTQKGREYLSTNSTKFHIVKFALADSEIDYNLFNTDAADSSNYGDFIKNMPLMEAVTNEVDCMKSKLVTLKKGTTKIPTMRIDLTTWSGYEGESFEIKPDIINYNTTGEVLSYTAVLRNTNLGELVVTEKTFDTDSAAGNQWVSTDDVDRVQVVIGRSFRFRAASDVTSISSNARSTTIEIYGNQVGGDQSISISVAHLDTSNVQST